MKASQTLQDTSLQAEFRVTEQLMIYCLLTLQGFLQSEKD